MDTFQRSSFSSKIQLLLDSEVEFTQKLKQHFYSKSDQVVNPFKFIGGLLARGVLRDESNDAEVNFGLIDTMVQVAMMKACTQGTEGIGSLIEALEESGNSKFISDFRAWIKQDFRTEIESNFGQPEETGSSALTVTGPAATGLFAATNNGLISLDLPTLEATVLTNERTNAVAVNHSLKKVYWSEGYDSRIIRSNFDGSAKEMIVPATGGSIRALAVDEASGKVYFARFDSHEIKVCNALGENSAVLISNSSLVNDPVEIAVDSEKGVLYWGNRRRVSRLHSVVRANLDGSNSAIISTTFQDLRGIALDQPSNGLLYWADWGAHTIGTIDVNDGKKRTLVQLDRNSGPWGIQLDDVKIYFSTNSNNTILSVDRNSGKELTTIFESTGAVLHLAIFKAPATQP